MGWILLGVALILGLSVVVISNGLAKASNHILSAWAQIDVQLRRRHDLIPELVETVQGCATHEGEALEALTQARRGALASVGVAEQARAENAVTSTLKSLFARSEASPELRADQGFLALQEELSGIEGRIAFARQFFNDTVLRYNTKIESFPSMLVARPLRLRAREYFEADPTSQGPVQVDL